MSVFIKPFWHNKTSRVCQYLPIINAGVATFSILGDNFPVVGSASSVIDAQGFRTRLETPASSLSDAGAQGSLIYARNLRSELYARFKLTSISSVRAFIGFTDRTLPVMVSSDNPAGHYFGLSYSTPFGDTNWQYIRKDGINRIRFNTGIPVDTNPHDLYLQMINFPSQVQAQIDDSDREPFTTNIPGLSTALRLVVGVETQAAAVKGIEIGKILTISDH